MIYFVYEKNMEDNLFINTLKQKLVNLELVSRETQQGGWNTILEKIFKFWIDYFKLSLSALKKSSKGDILMTWQVFVGVITGIIIKTLFIKRRLIILSFIYRPRKNRIINYIRFNLTKFGIAAAEKVICYSSYEAAHYTKLFCLKTTKFLFVQLGKTYENFTIAKSITQNNYIFSAGQSNRDFETLIDSVENLGISLIIASTSKIIVSQKLKSNISLVQLTGNSFNKILSNARLVIVTLKDTDYSSGQIVLINALAFGKCVIITETNWSKDYIVHGDNAWLVPPNDSQALSSAIDYLLKNDNIREKIEENARKSYLEYLNGEAFAKRLIKSMENNFQ